VPERQKKQKQKDMNRITTKDGTQIHDSRPGVGRLVHRLASSKLSGMMAAAAITFSVLPGSAQQPPAQSFHCEVSPRKPTFHYSPFARLESGKARHRVVLDADF
jgi:hypothetical protein